MKNTKESILSMYVPEPNTGCHLWAGCMDKDGYPLVKWQGKTHRAIRLIYVFRHGSIPEGEGVLHHCDTPQCIRDEHHFTGTTQVNQADKVAKGRQAKGLHHGRHTHPESTARGIRHGTKTHPESVRRGELNPQFGKKAPSACDPKTGRFIKKTC